MSDFYLKSESITLGDATFTTQQFPAMHSLEVVTQLAKQLGPVVTTLMGADQTANLSDIGMKLGDALKYVSGKELQVLVVLVLTDTTVLHNGKFIQLNNSSNIDRVFTGKLHHMFKVFNHAVQVNFGDFFGELLRGMAEQAAKAEAEALARAAAVVPAPSE